MHFKSSQKVFSRIYIFIQPKIPLKAALNAIHAKSHIYVRVNTNNRLTSNKDTSLHIYIIKHIYIFLYLLFFNAINHIFLFFSFFFWI